MIAEARSTLERLAASSTRARPTEARWRGPGKTRTKEIAAMALAGDAVLGLVMPRRHVERWAVGPASWRRTVRAAAGLPGMTRALAAGELAVWWASRLPGRPAV